MREASSQAKETLAEVNRLAPGSGSLDLFGFLDGDLGGGIVGGGVEYKHRVKRNLSAFLRGTAGYAYGDTRGLQYSALGGLEYRW